MRGKEKQRGGKDRIEDIRRLAVAVLWRLIEIYSDCNVRPSERPRYADLYHG